MRKRFKITPPSDVDVASVSNDDEAAAYSDKEDDLPPIDDEMLEINPISIAPKV